MSINIFCYSTLNPEDADSIARSIETTDQAFFEASYEIFNAIPISVLAKEIAMEHGLNAHSLFLVRMQKREQVMPPEEVASAIRRAFGRDGVLLLMNNETEI